MRLAQVSRRVGRWQTVDDSGSPSRREMVGRVLEIVTGMGRAVGAGEEWKLVT